MSCGCENNKCSTITLNSISTHSSPTIVSNLSVNPTMSISEGFPVTANVTGGTPPYTYEWSDKLGWTIPYYIEPEMIIAIRGIITGPNNNQTVSVFPEITLTSLARVMFTHLQCIVTDSKGNKANCYFSHHILLPGT